MIYLDNAATTLKKPPQVIQAVVHAMETMGNCARGSHQSSRNAARSIYEARAKLARFFGCSRPENVIFTSNGTHSLNLAINGLFRSGDHVITTAAEHNSVLRPLFRLEKEQGVELSILPADDCGLLQLDLLEKLCKPNTKAVVCTHASNLTGNVTDLKRISEFAKAKELILVVDASQTAGIFPIDMEKMGIHVLCLTGHKGMLGPQGTGCLCIGNGVSLRPLTVGGSGVQSYLPHQPQELPEHLEAGTLNAHGIAGLSAAVDWICQEGVEKLYAHETMLTRRFREGVRDLPQVKLYGSFAGEHCPIVSLNIGSWDSGAVADALAEDFGIATRSGAHCAPLMHEALGTRAQGAVRFSFSCFNTVEEVDAAIAAVKCLCEEAAQEASSETSGET